MRVLAIAVVFVAVVGASSQLHAQLPQFRGGVELVPVTVTVTDRQGRYVTDLRADDFSLSDNGVSARAEIFERERAALAMAVVVDSSHSMADRLPAVKEAVVRLFASLGPADSATIIDCDSTATMIAPLSRDLLTVGATLDTVTAGGTTALYDAVLRASTELHAFAPDGSPLQRRHAILVFSDGSDTSSSAGVDDVLAHAEQAGTVIYPIALGRAGVQEPHGIAALLQKQGAAVLRLLADRTGGRLFVASSVSDLPVIYRQLQQELTSQYLLGFTPQVSGSSQRHRIVVGVRRPGAVVRARAAYTTGNHEG